MGEETIQGRVPKSIRSEGSHSGFGTPIGGQSVEPEFPPGSLWNQSEPAEDTGTHEGKELRDPAIYDLPKGASLSTGPYTQDGVLIIGAPENSAFRFLTSSAPRVEGKLISRYGILLFKQPDGTLIDPPAELQALHWATTRKTHRLLPRHFKGADSARPLPNLGVTEEWNFE